MHIKVQIMDAVLPENGPQVPFRLVTALRTDPGAEPQEWAATIVDKSGEDLMSATLERVNEVARAALEGTVTV